MGDLTQATPREMRLANGRRKGRAVQGGGAKRLRLLAEIERKRYDAAMKGRDDAGSKR